MQILAPAKLNLCLDVIEREPAGYHKIRTVFCKRPELADELTINKTQEPDNTSIANPDPKRPIHQDQNLAHRAALLLKKTYNITTNFEIKIRKNIPLSSGLGGASSNAAAVLKGLSSLWGLGLTAEDLLPLAPHLGSDVAFFLLDAQVALGENRGEILTPLPGLPRGFAPHLHPQSCTDPQKTANTYAALDLYLCGRDTSKTDVAIAALKSQDTQALIAALHNDFETISPPPKGHHLSGAGPSTFTISSAAA